MANICYIAHHGIQGQKWGVRGGPPYPLEAGKHTAAEKKNIINKAQDYVEDLWKKITK